MEYVKTKLFWKTESGKQHICCVDYDDQQDYYIFLRKCRAKGYRQVIVTSEIMIQIIRHACLDKGHYIYRIEFAEDDTDLENEMDGILKAIHKNPAYFGDLLEKLRFLAEKTSIDLKRIYIKEKYKDTTPDNYFVQSNGIIGVNREAFSKVCLELGTLIERCLTG